MSSRGKLVLLSRAAPHNCCAQLCVPSMYILGLRHYFLLAQSPTCAFLGIQTTITPECLWLLTSSHRARYRWRCSTHPHQHPILRFNSQATCVHMHMSTPCRSRLRWAWHRKNGLRRFPTADVTLSTGVGCFDLSF